MADFPSFDDLPLQKDGPPGNAWGLFGADDELGRLNLLTPSVVKAAAAEIQEGTRVSLDWDLDKPSTPGFQRQTFEHSILNSAPTKVANDDVVCFNTQSSTQWDGFRHWGYQTWRKFYNGKTQEDFDTGDLNGINVWVKHGGIVGRGVLLDWADWATRNGIYFDALKSEAIKLAHLDTIMRENSITIKPGDILFLRAGYTVAYEKLSRAEKSSMPEMSEKGFIGLEATQDSLRWLWEQQFAAVASDAPAFEKGPILASFNHPDVNIHQWCLAGWGMPLGELFYLEDLASECRRLGRWTFFVTSIPLKVPGGVASPPNAVAIF